MSPSHFFFFAVERVWKLPGAEEGSGSLCASAPGSGVSTHCQPMAIRDVQPGHIGARIKAAPGSSLLDCPGLRFSGQKCLSAFWMPRGRICTLAGARDGVPLRLANINIIKLNIVFRDPGFSFM